jgi:hypothetical protein
MLKSMGKRIVAGLLLAYLISSRSLSQSSDTTIKDTLQARQDIIDIFIRLSKIDPSKHASEPDKKVFFSLVPLSGGSSDNNIAISSINMAFYLGDPATTNLSNVLFLPSTNFDTRFQFIVTPNLWFNNNSWNVPGKFEVSAMQQKTCGLGANTPKDSLNPVNYNLVKVIFSINRELFPNYFFGVGYSLYNFYNIDEEWNKPYSSEFEQYEYGTSSSALSSGISANVFYNTRRNVNNPLQGYYINVYYLCNSRALGSDYNWQMLYIDTRKYFNFSTNRHKILALWGLIWTTWGEVPYLNLPGSGLDIQGRSCRGYWKGRYQGKSMIYGEAEYRFDITRGGLIGGVLFANFQSYPEPETERLKHIKTAAGTGLRIKFNKYSDSNMTFDVAFGDDSFNWYVNLNEVF